MLVHLGLPVELPRVSIPGTSFTRYSGPLCRNRCRRHRHRVTELRSRHGLTRLGGLQARHIRADDRKSRNLFGGCKRLGYFPASRIPYALALARERDELSQRGESQRSPRDLRGHHQCEDCPPIVHFSELILPDSEHVLLADIINLARLVINGLEVSRDLITHLQMPEGQLLEKSGYVEVGFDFSQLAGDGPRLRFARSFN